MNRILIALFSTIFINVADAAVIGPGEYSPVDPVEEGVDFSVNGIYYKIIDAEQHHVSTVQGDKLYSGNVVIPDEVKYNNITYRVTKVSGFYNCPDVTEVTIPKYTTVISAFYAAPNGEGSDWVIKSRAATDDKPLGNLKTIHFNADKCISAHHGFKNSSFDGTYAYQVVFPRSVETIIFGDNVTHIPEGLLYMCMNLKSLTFPKAVTHIEKDIIYGSSYDAYSSYYDNLTSCTFNCENLQQLDWKPRDLSIVKLGPDFKTIPAGKNIGALLGFDSNNSANSVLRLPEGITTISAGALSDINGGTVICGKNVVEIGDKAFSNSFTSLIIEGDDTSAPLSIGMEAIQSVQDISITRNAISVDLQAMKSVRNLELNCKKLDFLSTVTFNRAEKVVWNVGECTNQSEILFGSYLSDVTLGENVKILPYLIFQNCTQLTSVNLPSNLEEIGYAAFKECRFLKNMEFPASLKRIGMEAFNGCSFITALTLPSTITWVGSDAFKGCPLASVFLDCENADLGEFGTDREMELTIGKNVKTFKATINGVKELYFPSTFETSELTCPNLASVTFGPEVTVIPNYFLQYSPLKSIEFQADITYLGASCFANSQIEKIVLPESLTTYYQSCYNHAAAKEVEINSRNLLFPFNFDLGETIKKITIGETVESITGGFISDFREGTTLYYNAISLDTDRNLFNWQNIDNVVIGNKVRMLPAIFMSQNETIKNITIPASVEKIGNSAFYKCTALEQITFLGEECVLGNSTFAECSNLKSISLPAKSTEIPTECFYNCTSLTSIDIPHEVNTIGSSAFEGCRSLKSLELPKGINQIPSYAFMDCSSLESLTIPENIRALLYWSFKGCSSLKSLVLETGTQLYSAFVDCVSLSSITCKSVSPPYCGMLDEFTGVDKTNCELIVPEEGIERYRTADVWKEFYNIKASGLELIAADAYGQPSAIYDINGRKINGNAENLAPGIYIFHNAEGSHKVLIR